MTPEKTKPLVLEHQGLQAKSHAEATSMENVTLERRKAQPRLRGKVRRKDGTARLPFVSGAKGWSDSRFWSVPASGGYFGGCKTGEAMATAYLKSLRESSGAPLPTIPWIISSFHARLDEAGGREMGSRPIPDHTPEYSSVHGQCVGFFSALERWLVAAAKQLGSSLDSVSEQELIRRANAGLRFDEAAYMASLVEAGACR